MQNSTAADGFTKNGTGKIAAYGIAAAAFFLFFMFTDGPFPEADSESYLTMHVFREPGYPLFLALCRHLPGAARFTFAGYAGLWYAVFLQSLLWIYATMRFSLLVEETARNSGWSGKFQRLAGWAAFASQIAVCLLNRFVSGRGALYSCSVLTESVTMPLYILFICRLFYLMRDNRTDGLLRCAACALVLMVFRKHMTVTLLIWGFAVFVIRLLYGRFRHVRTFLIHCAVILAVFLLSQLVTRCYNLALYRTFAPQAGRSEGMMCMLLYTAEEEDAERFREEEGLQRQWFTAIAVQQRAQGARYADAPADGGWIARYEYFMERYDVIGYGIVHDVLFAVAEDSMGTDAANSVKAREMYELEGTLLPGLLRQDLRDYVRVYADNLLAGLVFSNARVTAFLIPVSVLFYVLYIVLFVRSAYGKRPGEATETDNRTPADIPLLAFLVLSGLVINAAVVAAFIFSQPRYDIYSMAVFYAMIVVMGIDFMNRQMRIQ